MSTHLPSFAVAHVRESKDGAHAQYQSVKDHLCAVADLAASFAAKASLEQAGWLMGLLHDFGKYSPQFQHYILSACGCIAPNDPAYVDPVKNKGKIHHSTAGAQALWRRFAGKPKAEPWAQMLALCIASHHAGLRDCISPEGKDSFQKRMDTDLEISHLLEALEHCDAVVSQSLQGEQAEQPLTAIRQLYAAAMATRQRVAAQLPEGAPKADMVDNVNSRDFQQGLLTRFLLSCLLDADRIDCAEFDDPAWKAQRACRPQRPWDRLVARLEAHLDAMTPTQDIDYLRRRISDNCVRRAEDNPGLFTLTVPTGGGKTLASLRFALRHAQKHTLDRIIYIIPYTSIIDQNAQVAREILEVGEEPGSIVLEHHSTVTPPPDDSELEGEAKHWERLAENWEAPVIFTTMVQFLESLFGSGTRHARRMHNLAHSVIIFDEVQSLPLRCLHMFCNAVDFLIGSCGASVILCTATQPRFDNVLRAQLGSLRLTPEREIMDDVAGLFADLRRTDFFDHCNHTMGAEEVAALALEELRTSGSCLVVCNTKGWAEKIYALCGQQWDGTRYYLSTNLCPAHRMHTLANMRAKLAAKLPVLCVSTQCIECGVDISFGAVIRLAAGLDSILQAAGRCNRHGGPVKGRVHIVKVDDAKSLQKLEDIKAGQSSFFDVRSTCTANFTESGGDFTQPSIITEYFNRYFQLRKNIMQYAVPQTAGGTLLHMLGSNADVAHRDEPSRLYQSFASAAALFHAIDAPTRAVLVPWDQEGADIIADLCSTEVFHQRKTLLRKAQRYAVNIYPHTFNLLIKENALSNLQQSDTIALLESYYSEEFGVVTQPTGFMRPNIICQEDG